MITQNLSCYLHQIIKNQIDKNINLAKKIHYLKLQSKCITKMTWDFKNFKKKPFQF